MECDRVNRNWIKNKSLDTGGQMPCEWLLKAKFHKLSSCHIPSLNISLPISGTLQTLGSGKQAFCFSSEFLLPLSYGSSKLKQNKQNELNYEQKVLIRISYA